jgi:hypothetical protein
MTKAKTPKSTDPVEPTDPAVEPVEAPDAPEALVAPEPTVEIAPGATVAAGGQIVPVQVVTTPVLFGFEEEAPKESNGILDEPDPAGPVALGGGEPEVGLFVGFGVEHLSRADGEWHVDPDTGCITGPVV